MRRRLSNRAARAVPPPCDRLEPRVLLSAAHVDSPADGAANPLDPDLVVRFIRHPPRTMVVGGTRRRLSIVVANRGHGYRAQPTTVTLYLSSDASLDTGDRALGTASVRGRLKPGRRSAKSLRVTFPMDLVNGSYHVLAHVDDGNENAEVDETNNVADAGTISYAAPFADIVPLALKDVRMYWFHTSSVYGVGTLWVRNAGNADFTGTISGTISSLNIDQTYTKQVSIKRGAIAKIGLALPVPPTMGSYLFTITADGPADPTPGQGVSAMSVSIDRRDVG